VTASRKGTALPCSTPSANLQFSYLKLALLGFISDIRTKLSVRHRYLNSLPAIYWMKKKGSSSLGEGKE